MKKRSLLIKNAKILENNHFTSEKIIKIENGMIHNITDDSENADINSTNPTDTNIIDAATFYITPGLIDNHVHLILNGAADIITYVKKTTTEEFKKHAKDNLRQSLVHGITTIRDMGDTAGILAEIKQKHSSNNIHLLSSGEMLTGKKGHVKTIGKNLSTSPQQINTAVDQQIAQQANYIKLIISGGMLTPGSNPLKSELPPTIVTQACKRAKQHQRPIAAHAYSNHDIINAINAGVNTIEHGLWASKKTLQIAAKKNVLFTPTLKAAYDIIEHKDLLPTYMIKNADLIINRASTFIKQAKQSEVKLAMGTDAGTPFNYHGENAKELTYLTEHGLSTIEAIQSATKIPGHYLPTPSPTGMIKEGYTADLLILEKNPLDDIKVFQHNIKYVISKGICIKTK